MFRATEGRGTGGYDFPPKDGEDVPFHRRKGTKGRWGTFDVPQTPDDRLLRGLRPPGRGGHTHGDGGSYAEAGPSGAVPVGGEQSETTALLRRAAGAA